MKQKYSNEKKLSIITRYISGNESVKSIISDTGIPKSTFYNWIRDYQAEQSKSKDESFTLKNFHLLENRVAKLEGIIEILNSVDCSPNSPLKQKLYAGEKLYNKYSAYLICEALNIPRGTFYNHVLRNKKDNSWYSKRREELRIRIREIYDENNQIFGANKIAAIMKNEGIKTSTEMVRELMHDMGLASIRQISKKLYEDERKKHKNYLNQNFDTKKPNEVWVSDITYFKCNSKSYYICVIIDLFSRMVISYRISKTNSTQLVKSTLKKAYENRHPDSNLIFHTDRGANYCSKTVSDYLKSLNITHSFSRAYVPYDNSVMESFFASMKKEELYRRIYKSEKDFFDAVDEYIIFYNTKRPHRKLHYKTPKQKEDETAL